jgi:hypothetical protein
MMLFINNNTRKTKIYLKWYINGDLSIPFISHSFHLKRFFSIQSHYLSDFILFGITIIFSENWLISDMNRRRNFKYKVSKSFTRLFPKRFISLLFQRMIFFCSKFINLFDFTPLHYLKFFIRCDLFWVLIDSFFWIDINPRNFDSINSESIDLQINLMLQSIFSFTLS